MHAWQQQQIYRVGRWPYSRPFRDSPFAFAPPCPFSAGATGSFRSRLLGGRTLERRKWCWSWFCGTGGGELLDCKFSGGPDGFGVEVGRLRVKLELAAVDGLRISSSSLFVLVSSLAWSPLSSSSQPSSLRAGFFGPSPPDTSPWPTVILTKHNHRRFFNI